MSIVPKKDNPFRLAIIAITLVCTCSQTIQIAAQEKSTVSDDSVNGLQQRKLDLQNQLVDAQRIGGAVSANQIRSLQEQLLEVTGHEDALRQQPPAAAKSWGSITNYLALPIYYVTDRSTDSSGRYGDDLSPNGVAFGVATVTLGVTYGVRADRILGSRALPQASTVPAPVVAHLAKADLFDSLTKNKMDVQGHPRRVLLFVHGYNVSFSDAMIATARLSTEVQYSVIPVAYSWPSSGTYSGYWHDEDTVRASSVRFMGFIEDLLAKSPVEVDIVCHSMGAREVAASLAELGRRGVKLPALHKVVFAAGDISTQEFENAWADIKRLGGVQFGFYASNHDLPLRLSHIAHDQPRLGDASPHLFAPAGGVTIDASAVDPIFQALGHSYILNSPKVGADIGSWIDAETSPPDRGLTLIQRLGQTYYMFP